MQRGRLETGGMSNAERVLRALGARLNRVVELVLYGRAALQLGFPNPPGEYAQSRDVDVVLWLGQADELAATTNFWESVEAVNREFSHEELYLSHLFEETQVVLRPDWRKYCVRIPGDWPNLALRRLGDLDLFLSKLMRDDPVDLADARFIVERARLTTEQIRSAIQSARVPDIPEVQEQFALCSKRVLPPQS
jgi:hypothetical protein